MTEQKEHYDPYIARYRALLEKHGLTPLDLNDHIEKHRILYLSCRLIYAIEDTLSFLFGNIKLYFSLVASYYHQSDAGSADDLHTSLQSLPDLLIILAVGIPLAIIQVLGTYFSDSKDLKPYTAKHFLAKILAPYLRDVLQGIKWAYKAMRTVLNTIFHFMPKHKELIMKILFPLSIAIAVVSLLNRIFLRTLRNFRKLRQSSNRKTTLATIEEGYFLKFRTEKPTKKEELAKLKNSLVFVPDENNSFNIYYINSESESEKLELDNKDDITKTIQDYQSQNICHRLKPEFVGQDKNREVKDLHFVGELPESLSNYKNSLIFLTDDNKEQTKRLYYVNSEGRSELHEASAYFTKAVANEIKNKSSLILHPLQLDYITKALIQPQCQLGLTLDEWDKRKAEKEIKNLPGSLVFFCYASVVLSALIDGAYFYLGVLFIASFNPAVFIVMLGMAAIMMTVCLVGRVYEEYCYQKAFKVSQIEVNLAIQKTELNILTQEIEKLMLENGDKNLLKLNELFQRFRKSLFMYDSLQRQLESSIRISAPEALLRGFRNGLSTQGVISALMFFGVTIMLFTGTACPPVFVIIMMSVSFLALSRSVCRYMQSYYEYKKKDTPLKDLTDSEIGNCTVNHHAQIPNVYQNLIEAKQKLDDRIIAKPPNLYEEENSEVVRLICSGFTKAEKNFGECTLGEPRQGEEWWLTLTSLIFGVAMGGVFGVRGVHKMYSGQDDSPNICETKVVQPTKNFRLPLKRVHSSSENTSKYMVNYEEIGTFRASSPVPKNLNNTEERKNEILVDAPDFF